MRKESAIIRKCSAQRTGEPFHYASIQHILSNVMNAGILRSGETKSEVFPELQIVSLEQFNRVAKTREQRSVNYAIKCGGTTETVQLEDGTEATVVRPPRAYPRKIVGKALLSGNVYCGHCGGRIFAATARKTHRPTESNERIAIYKSSMRTLPLVGSFAEYFKEAKAAQEVNKKVCGNCYNYEYDGYVFVDELGDLMRPEYLTSYFPQYIQKHGCKRMRFHDLRHSCASLLLANGVPLKQIQEWLGHSDFSTTANIYAHLDYTSKLSSAKAMVSGMALPESVNFGSKWAEISADDGKN